MSTGNPTRQQLEELDALLQRMLQLPLNQPDPELPPPLPQTTSYAAPPRRRAEPPSGLNSWNVPLPTSAPPVLNNWPAGVESLSASATSTVTPRPAPARLRVSAVAPPEEPMPAPMREPPPQRLRVEPPPAMTIPIPPPRPLPISLPQQQPLPFYLWPLGVVDQSMGNALAAFGAPGRWLGQGSGKVFFGWCGLLGMAGAAVWGVMDYMGWSW
jgi:hypothetical protein